MVEQNQVCYRTFHLDKPWTLDAYKSIGGYSAWRRILKEQTPPQQIIEELKTLPYVVVVEQDFLRGLNGAS